ncbi:hypothetical protein CK203_034474 [Vitis vinifera]|uniref:Uncharacterized protein n=1 Tax=Vitis vinifera TaxID=29760 RepID=A0A438HZG7_VITVI|nr:hypothetical protein CK203_034474 [Vitis vinifera]
MEGEMKKKLLNKVEKPGGEIEVDDEGEEGMSSLRTSYGVRQRSFGVVAGLPYSPDFRRLV